MATTGPRQFPANVISNIYERYKARYPHDLRCASRLACVSRAWAFEVEKQNFRRLIIDVSDVSRGRYHEGNHMYNHPYGSTHGGGGNRRGIFGRLFVTGDDLILLESYMRGVRRTFVRELVFVLPDPMRHLDACNALLRRLLDVLSGWGLPAPMQRAYIDLEVFLTDDFDPSNREMGTGIFLFDVPEFSLANASHVRSVRPGPLPFATVFSVKHFIFGRNQRFLKVDAWRAQLCPKLADSLIGVSNDTFVIGDGLVSVRFLSSFW
ncbi:hypothetical protein PG994_014096 [Apiospora phragmitis]|uniref:F-box domain-containing protein n=1 Tax=Apiospora phragmitis TaxID=2905665 RepID=A0ABR1T5C8_9PEZI